MATKVDKNWLSRLKENLNKASHQESESVPNQVATDDEVRAALQREMANQVLDNRSKHLTYRMTVI